MLRVFDGDGFLTRIVVPGINREVEVAVRFGFIDAPEIGQPGGCEARDFLNQLIGGQWLDLVILTKMDTGRIIDRHGRIVAVPYLQQECHEDPKSSSILSRLFGAAATSAKTWRNIELEMVLNGWAWVLDRYGPAECYFDALEDAQLHRRGIWTRDNNVHPGKFKSQKYVRPKQDWSAQHGLKLPSGTGGKCCPMDGCAGTLKQRTGRYGVFYGCSLFPECRYSCTHPD